MSSPVSTSDFILSLGSCDSCLVVDDELNVLPISGGKNVKPLPPPESTDESASAQEGTEGNQGEPGRCQACRSFAQLGQDCGPSEGSPDLC